MTRNKNKKTKKKKKKDLSPKQKQRLTAHSVATDAMTDMAMAALTGQSIPTEKITLTIDVPTSVVTMAKQMAIAYDTTKEAILAGYVKEGIDAKLNLIKQMSGMAMFGGKEKAPVPPTPDISSDSLKKFEETIGNMGNLKDLMSTLNNLTESLQELETNASTPTGDVLKD